MWRKQEYGLGYGGVGEGIRMTDPKCVGQRRRSTYNSFKNKGISYCY